MSRPRIQVISANPLRAAPISIEEEKRDVFEPIRNRATVFYSSAARFRDVISSLRRNNPSIVHVITHGTQLDELLLNDGTDQPSAIPKLALIEAFRMHGRTIRVVILNGCFTAYQAELISNDIDVVIGVREKLPDKAGVKYASLFYEAVCERQSVLHAHQEAVTLLLSERLPPENRPQLFCRPGFDAATLRFGLSKAREIHYRGLKQSGKSERLLSAKKALLKDDDLQKTIAVLEAEQTRGLSRSEKQRLDPYTMRNLPAFLEDVWTLLIHAGFKKDAGIDREFAYTNFAHVVSLCDKSAILWKDERPPRSPLWWHRFNKFAEFIRVEADRKGESYPVAV